MPNNIYLIDIDPHMCQAWKQLQLPSNVNILNQSVMSLNLKGTTIYVSPANSFGVMRGGLDGVYSKMFPTIEKHVQKEIQSLGYINDYKEHFLPVCSALLIKIKDDKYLITCPSMMFPGSNISNTDNVYHCYRAILTLMKKIPFEVDNLVMSGIGTGVGGVDVKKCAQDFHRALMSVDSHDESPNLLHLVLNTQIKSEQ